MPAPQPPAAPYTEWAYIDASDGTLVTPYLTTEPAPGSWGPEYDGYVGVPALYPDALGWNPTERVFFALPTAILIRSRLTKTQFKRLFTQAERIAIRNSADDVVIDFFDLANTADEINLDDPDVIAGVQYLEANGILLSGRASEILQGISSSS